jgi:hypothetical protein
MTENPKETMQTKVSEETKERGIEEERKRNRGHR